MTTLVGTDVWLWNTQTATPPASGQMRTNSGTWATALFINIDLRNNAGADQSALLAQIKAGDYFHVQHNTDPSRSADFVVTADPTTTTPYYAFPVLVSATSGAVPNSSTQIQVQLYAATKCPHWDKTPLAAHSPPTSFGPKNSAQHCNRCGCCFMTNATTGLLYVRARHPTCIQAATALPA